MCTYVAVQNGSHAALKCFDATNFLKHDFSYGYVPFHFLTAITRSLQPLALIAHRLPSSERLEEPDTAREHRRHCLMVTVPEGLQTQQMLTADVDGGPFSSLSICCTSACRSPGY